MVPGLRRPEGERSAPFSLVEPKASVASEKQGPPWVWLPNRQAGKELPFLPHPHTSTRETQVECFSQNPIQSTATLVPAPAPFHRAIHPKILSSASSSPFPKGQLASRRHSQCTHAYLRQFSKVPVYLLSGRCPQNIMHHTYKSFTRYCHFFFRLFFLSRLFVCVF